MVTPRWEHSGDFTNLHGQNVAMLCCEGRVLGKLDPKFFVDPMNCDNQLRKVVDIAITNECIDDMPAYFQITFA